MILFTKLLLAHLIGDFLLQPKSWVKDKEERNLRSAWLYFHAIIHGVLVFGLVWDLQFWWPAAIVAVSHLLIDAIKSIFQHKNTQGIWFVVDQLLHILVIAILVYSWQGISFPIETLSSAKTLIYITGIFALLSPSAIAIKVLISKWAPQAEDEGNGSLQNAGKYIGMLERLFVFAFVMAGQWKAIGFLIAAKSIFRFGDLREAKDIKLTEYMLIGTLLSIGLAIGISLLVQHYVNI